MHNREAEEMKDAKNGGSFTQSTSKIGQEVDINYEQPSKIDEREQSENTRKVR